MGTDRPLTEQQTRFADAYARLRDGVKAAKAAGYGGSAASLASIASRLVRDERVAARIAASTPRPSQPAQVPPPETNASPGPDGDDDDPIETLRRLHSDEGVHPTARIQAAKALDRHQREERVKREAWSPEALQAKVQLAIKAIRERELETGCCSRCGAPLRERGR